MATVDEKGNIYAIQSGVTIITVKAEENDVQNQIEIMVYSKVTGVFLDQSEIYMQVGDTFQIHGTIEPDDANEKTILYGSSDQQVATIDEKGILSAHQEGEALITALSAENTNIKAECKVFVVRKMEDYEIHFDPSLTMNSLEISGIDCSKNTVADIKGLITTDLELEFVNNKNEILKETDLLGTGCKIRVKENGVLLREYKIILYGDANGDGRINSIDLLVIQRHILEIDPLREIYKKASRISKDGKKPTSVDLLMIQRHILGLQKIEQ